MVYRTALVDKYFFESYWSLQDLLCVGMEQCRIKNADQFEFYVPYKGHASASDFVMFYKNEKTLFQKDVAGKKLYK